VLSTRAWKPQRKHTAIPFQHFAKVPLASRGPPNRSFRNLPFCLPWAHNRPSPMTYLPASDARRRAPRTSFAELTPAVLRCKNGRRVSGKLQVISLTGGLLCLPSPLDQGCQVKLMFLTAKGSVLGAAEMLNPISWSLQPFKFVGLYDDDQDKLQAAIQSSLKQNRQVHGQMERHRAW
jgi:hypothetical protein